MHLTESALAAVLGWAFINDSDDARNTPAGAEGRVHDPWVDSGLRPPSAPPGCRGALRGFFPARRHLDMVGSGDCVMVWGSAGDWICSTASCTLRGSNFAGSSDCRRPVVAKANFLKGENFRDLSSIPSSCRPNGQE